MFIRRVSPRLTGCDPLCRRCSAPTLAPIFLGHGRLATGARGSLGNTRGTMPPCRNRRLSGWTTSAGHALAGGWFLTHSYGISWDYLNQLGVRAPVTPGHADDSRCTRARDPANWVHDEHRWRSQPI